MLQQGPVASLAPQGFSCLGLAGAAKQGRKDAAEELDSDRGSSGSSGAEPSASVSGSDFAADGAGEQEEEDEEAAQASSQEGDGEEVAREASAYEGGGDEAAAANMEEGGGSGKRRSPLQVGLSTRH